MHAVLTHVSLEHHKGVLGIIGAPKDGTTLLCDVIDGAVKPSSGRVALFGGSPQAVRSRLARVSLNAPLPDALRVEEVCDLAGRVRGETEQSANDRLAVLGVTHLAARRTGSLALEERRAVALAIALTSKAELMVLEEPLAAMDAVASSRVVAAIRARAASAAVVVTTASTRDAAQLADQLAVLTTGHYTALSSELVQMRIGPDGSAAMRVIVSPSVGKAGAAVLVGALSASDAVSRVETSAYGLSGVAVVVSGRDLALLAAAVTHAIATARVDVELVESSPLSLDAIVAALAARAISPPPASPSGQPVVMPGPLPPGSVPVESARSPSGDAT